MFTGIIAALGKIQTIDAKGGDVRLDVAMEQLDLSDVILGDSIAINGVCLTVVQIAGDTLSFDVSRETLERSSLGTLKNGSEVNLEKALAVGDRLGGHFVSGHVDGLGDCILREASARSIKFRFTVPAGLERYIAEKGAICVDGTSLTVNNAMDNWFEVNIIPHTLEETIIKTYQIGSKVNLEVDLIARYLERLLPQEQTGITHETLLKHGFVK
jgi:riboflavin synthase